MTNVDGTASAGPGSPGEGASNAPVPVPVPGTVPRKRFRPRVDWELVACGLHGHVLAGTDAAEIGPEHETFVRPAPEGRWYRCLRCDAWVPMPEPVEPTTGRPPRVDELELPLRGRRLRDRYVLRLIVVDRAVHIAVLGALAAAIFLFAANERSLHQTYIQVLNGLQSGVGGPSGRIHSGIVGDVNRLFSLPRSTIYLVGAAVSAYVGLLVIEAIGLWHARRWAEYLTLLETSVLVPFEVYELVGSVSALTVLTLVINLAIVFYLLLAHRLFGVRGGRRAALEHYGEA